MRVGMIQANYIPWRGYFDFIDDVDVFVFYDDVPFGTGKKWRNRNKIKTPTGTKWLTVPLQGGREHTLIQDVQIDHTQNWQKRHLGALREYYGGAPFYGDYIESFASIIWGGHKTITEVNLALFEWVLPLLHINTELKLSRGYQMPAGSKEERPLWLLQAMGATTYVLGPTAKPYTDERAFYDLGIALEYKQYDYKPYPQIGDTFEDDVSILDLLFNLGPEAARHIKSHTPNEIVAFPPVDCGTT